MKNKNPRKYLSEQNGLKVWKRRLFVGMAIGIFLLLSACGKEEGSQLGIDGYVYTPRKIGGSIDEDGDTAPPPNVWTKNSCPSGFKTAGDYLYYVQYSSNGDNCTVKRLPLGEEFDFSKGEMIISTDGLQAYTIDGEQNVYYFNAKTRLNSNYSYSFEGGSLCKISPEGKTLFNIKLEEHAAGGRFTDSLAVDKEGNVFFLTLGKILKIDKEGNLAGEIITDENHDQQIITDREYLLETAEGNVYYVNGTSGCRVWECLGGGNLRLEEISVLGGSGVIRLYKGREGLLLTDKQDVLYEYQKGQVAPEALLRWQESGIIGEEMDEVIPISENTILTLSNGYPRTRELLILKKTPVEELPRKEELVIASLSPDLSLRQAVISFNQTSDKYFVRIERYGEHQFQGSGNVPEGAAVRLDSAVSSASECPDLLDLTGLDVYKYAGKDALEDLTSYTEGSQFRRENFLENALDGYTIDGKLVCIPKSFYFTTIAGRTNQVGDRTQWTAQDFTRMTENYPESIGIVQYTGAMDGETLLKKIFPYYYLKKFVDWEKGKCYFNTQEFYILAEWIMKHNGDGKGRGTTGRYLPEDVLLREESIHSFTDYFILNVLYKDEVAFVGYPCINEFPLHKANVKDCIGILSHSNNKEAAWEFLEYYLTVEDADYYENHFSTRIDLLQAQANDAVTPITIVDGEIVPYEEGKGTMKPKGSFFIEDVEIPYYFIPPEQVDIIIDAIHSVDFSPLNEQEKVIINIVAEEMAYYLNGAKTVEEAAEVIQSRVDIVAVQRMGLF